ncbi:MAG: hypothetical protein L6V88_01605 [Anaerotruncus sp.]|nr:MAG: hypothetical protein L6V88_01605 [Anaerotruncus sp.]
MVLLRETLEEIMKSHDKLLTKAEKKLSAQAASFQENIKKLHQALQ